MPRAKMSGIPVQPISSMVLPSTVLPTSPGDLRWYLKAATITSSVTRTAKNKQVSRINEKRASTFPAKLEACSGKNGSGDCTALMCSLRRRTWPGISLKLGTVIAPPKYHETDGHAQQRDHPAHADDRENRGAVTRLGRIVLVAKQQNVIHRGAYFSGRSIHQAQTNVAGWIIHTEKVARDAPIGGQKQD